METTSDNNFFPLVLQNEKNGRRRSRRDGLQENCVLHKKQENELQTSCAPDYITVM